MIKFDNTETWGFRNAILGIRNSYDSKDKSDSYFNHLVIGEKDMKLIKALIKEGEPCRKFLRMIHTQCDITAPLYWWKQFDTYKIGTVANSSSTMHLLTKKEITLDDFSTDVEGLAKDVVKGAFGSILRTLNELRESYVDTKNKGIERLMFQVLPESYNQLRTVDLNYEVLLQIYKWRKNHKLTEWHTFCEWIEKLPYMKDFLSVFEEKSC